jgi:diketogulonate reductase-like aldo/keto reductase
MVVVEQVEMHPCWQQKQLREYCKNKGIQITAYSPLTSPAPEAEVYFNQRIAVLKDPIILAIAEQHAKSPAQVHMGPLPPAHIYIQMPKFSVSSEILIGDER